MGEANTVLPRRLGVIVVNYGASGLIEQNLEVGRYEPAPIVVVVDNWSSAEERARIVTLGQERDWVVVTPRTNLGFGGGVNRGVAAARERGADDMLLLNPDASIEPADLKALADAALADRHGIYAPIIRRPDGRVWFQGLWVDHEDGRMRRYDDPPEKGHLWLTGACLLIPAEAWDRIGGFDESFFLYWEDVDLSRRALDAGCSLNVVREATAVHDVGGTQSSRGQAKSPVYYYYSIRNRMLYATKHLARGDVRRWRETDVREAWRILMRGGRRQFLHPIEPSTAMVRGLVAGRRLAATAMKDGITRVYITARTAHLERDAGRADVTLLYEEQRYDFERDAGAGLDVVPAKTGGVFWHLLRTDSAVVELNEPLFLRAVSRSLAALAALEIRRIVGRGRAVVVAYCIENLDPRGNAFRLPPAGRVRQAGRLLLSRLVWRRLDRVAFGTPGARDLYRSVYGDVRGGPTTLLIPALPGRRTSSVERSAVPTVVFLGAFVERKGFYDVLTAWPHVAQGSSDARLVLIGKGRGEDAARELAEADDRVDVLIDPPRARIFDELDAATVLVLPSKRQRSWREQVGLPIVEGLGSGCEIVTTPETGLAEWLHAHGHRVVEPDAAPAELARAILDALASERSQADVLGDLPTRDGREEADRWLTRRTVAPAPTDRT